MALRRWNANFDLRRRVLCGPAQGKQSGRDPRERFAQAKRKFWAPETRFVWPCAGKTVRPSVSRRRNANFELPRCIFCGPAQAKRKFWPPETNLLSRWSGFTRSQNRMTKIAMALQRDAKKFPARSFAQAKRKFWPPEVRFSWPCAVKNEPDKKKHLDLRGFTLTVRTPQCDTLFGEWKHMNHLGVYHPRQKPTRDNGKHLCLHLHWLWQGHSDWLMIAMKVLPLSLVLCPWELRLHPTHQVCCCCYFARLLRLPALPAVQQHPLQPQLRQPRPSAHLRAPEVLQHSDHLPEKPCWWCWCW